MKIDFLIKQYRSQRAHITPVTKIILVSPGRFVILSDICPEFTFYLAGEHACCLQIKGTKVGVVVHTYDTNSQEVKGQDKKISVIKTLSIFFFKGAVLHWQKSVLPIMIVLSLWYCQYYV